MTKKRIRPKRIYKSRVSASGVIVGKRGRLSVAERVPLGQRRGRPQFIAETYVAAVNYGLLALVGPKIMVEGKTFRPSIAFIDEDYCMYALMHIVYMPKSCSPTYTSAYNRTGLPWCKVTCKEEIQPMLAFVAECRYTRDIRQVAHEQFPTLHPTITAGRIAAHSRKTAESDGGRKGTRTPSIKGAYVPPPSRRGLGKFR